MGWTIENSSYKQNIEATIKAIDNEIRAEEKRQESILKTDTAYRKLQERLEKFRSTSTGSNIASDWTAFNDALGAGNVDQAGKELDLIISRFTRLSEEAKLAKKETQELLALERKGTILKTTVSGKKFNLDFTPFEDAVKSGSLDKASSAFKDLRYEFDLLNASSVKDLPSNAVESMTKKIQDTREKVQLLGKDVEDLGLRGQERASRYASTS